MYKYTELDKKIVTNRVEQFREFKQSTKRKKI